MALFYVFVSYKDRDGIEARRYDPTTTATNPGWSISTIPENSPDSEGTTTTGGTLAHST